jgi:hypothetical protein
MYFKNGSFEIMVLIGFHKDLKLLFETLSLTKRKREIRKHPTSASMYSYNEGVLGSGGIAPRIF